MERFLLSSRANSIAESAAKLSAENHLGLATTWDAICSARRTTRQFLVQRGEEPVCASINPREHAPGNTFETTRARM